MTTILVKSGQISSGFSLGGSGSLLEVEQGGTAVNALLFSNVSALIEGFGSDIYLVGGVGRIENGGMLVSATFSTSFNGTTNYLFVSSGGTAIATTMEAGSAEVFSGGVISNTNIDSGVITTIFGGGSEIGTTVTGGADTVSSGGHSAASIGLGNTTTVSAALSGPYSGAESTVVPLGGLSVTASPNSSDPLAAVLSVAHGTVSAGGQSGASITLTGTAAQIDSVLSRATYEGGVNYFGSDTVSLTVSDTVDGSHAAGSASISLGDTSRPAQTIGGSYSGAENAAVPLGGFSVSVSPNGSDVLTTVISVQSGTVSAGGMSGASITLSGTAAQIDSVLSGATYRGNGNFYGSDTLSMTTTDTQDNQTTGAKTTGITVNPVAEAPNLAVTAASGNENGGPIALTITASQAAANLSPSDLTITVSGLAGGSLDEGTVNPGGSVTLTPAELAGLTYTPAANTYGTVDLSVTATDSEPASGTSATTSPQILAVTVADTSIPGETVGGPYTVNENGTLTLTNALSVSASPNTGDPLSAVLGVSHGTLAIAAAGGAAISGSGTGSVTVRGSVAQIDAALGGATYKGAANFYGSDTLSMTTTDTADGKSTGAKTATIAVADTATIGETLPGSLSGAYGAPLPLAGISVSDNPNTGDTLTTVLKVANGMITVGSGSGASVSGNGTGTVTLSGTQATIDAAIASADYLAKASSAGTDTLSMTTTDPTGRSSGTKTVAIAANAPSAPDLGLGLGAGPAGALNETNLSNPLFAGTSEPIGVILLYDNGDLVGGGIAGLQGQWAGAPLLPLATGTHSITANTLSLFGFSAVSAPATITEIKGTAFGGTGVTQNVNFQAGDGNNTMQWVNGIGAAIAGDGNNAVTAGNGADAIVLGNGSNTVMLGNGNDSVTAGTGKNSITLGSGNDTLSLGAGGNSLTLGSGSYAIGVPSYGYGGGDTIILKAPPADLTLGYYSGDKIVFDNTGFDLGSYDGKGTGTPQQIGSTLFSTNTNGTFATAADRFAYNQTTGGLYYDAQGNKAGSTKELVVQFTNDPHLTAANLYFIA